MYTECPHCESAFRVTARDLQRAGGHVVCAGCRREFNALERLTEDPPEATRQAAEAKSLLDTLNELTGPHEIRIEDTGVEWRVIEDDIGNDFDAPGDDIGNEIGNEIDNNLGKHTGDDVEVAPEWGTDQSGSPRWYIDDVPEEAAGTPDDAAGPDTAGPGFTEATPATEPAGESSGAGRVDSTSARQDSLELPPPPAGYDVQRYDDNTPLSDDFPEELEPETPQRRVEDRLEPRSPEADEAQVDLALGDPDEWVELLDEVGQRSEREVPGDDDSLQDTDIQPLVAEAGSLAEEESFPSDLDTQFDLQAIELGIEVTGTRKFVTGDQAAPRDGGAREEQHASPLCLQREDPYHELILETPEEDLATDGVPEQEIATAAMVRSGPADGSSAPVEQSSGAEDWLIIDDDALLPAASDSEKAEERNREQAFEQELATSYALTVDDEATGAPDAPSDTEHFVPPPTEEEMTINLLIDQDLIRLAEQQDVFTSTSALKRIEDAPHVETIIMEGEFVRNALEAELLSGQKNTSTTDACSGLDHLPASADKSAATRTLDMSLDPYAGSKGGMDGLQRGGGAPAYRLIAGVSALTLLLAAQVVHAYRDSLATYVMFDRTVGSVYRLFGEPLNPDWDIRKWQFEATSGSTDEMDEVLTISSRVANSSGRPLPYPLLHVSLTDRWEEIIGSKVLGPAEYLAGGSDAAARVAPGQSFTALVRVEAPAPEATGFKLNVCYPESPGRVRCATEDFKD